MDHTLPDLRDSVLIVGGWAQMDSEDHQLFNRSPHPPLLEEVRLEMTNPDKPKNSRQKYRTVSKM